jgi:hypothetical protein
MTTTTTRLGRPSKDDLAQREQREREAVAAQLARAVQHLNHPSRLSESPLCELPCVRAHAAALRGQHFARARIVIAAVRQAHEAAWAELGETADACCLRALADALKGRSREESARAAGVSPTEISRRRREAVEIIVDTFLDLLQRPSTDGEH